MLFQDSVCSPHHHIVVLDTVIVIIFCTHLTVANIVDEMTVLNEHL